MSRLLMRSHKFVRLGGQQRRVFFEAFALLVLVRVGLKFLPLADLQRRLERPLGKRTGIEEATVLRNIEHASTYITGVTCLAKALAARRLLERYGFPSDLCIGVYKDSSLHAHAWLHREGRVVLGNVTNLANYRLLEPQGGTWPA